MSRLAVRLLHAGHGDERDARSHRKAPDLTEEEVREQLDGNLCRCTGYHNIVKAVLQGAQAMKAAAESRLGSCLTERSFR